MFDIRTATQCHRSKLFAAARLADILSASSSRRGNKIG